MLPFNPVVCLCIVKVHASQGGCIIPLRQREHTEASKSVDFIYGQWFSNHCSLTVGTPTSAEIQEFKKSALGQMLQTWSEANNENKIHASDKK